MDVRVQFVIDFMKRNLEKDFALSQIATLLNLSDSRLRHLFTAETGVSPKTHMRKLRLAAAKDLLRSSLLSIDQVAMKVGWRDRSHFERRFKQLYGITPAQYHHSERLNLLECGDGAWFDSSLLLHRRRKPDDAGTCYDASGSLRTGLQSHSESQPHDR